MKFPWNSKKMSFAEKLAHEHELTKQFELREKLPRILAWDYSSKADGYKYIEHHLTGLNPQNREEILWSLENNYGFILMHDNQSCYIVVSEAVAAGRERAGWKRITAHKQDLPLPCQGG